MIREDTSETASASVSTAMHQMIDGLVDSETSDRPPFAQHFPQISHGQSLPTPTIDQIDVLDTNIRQGRSLTAKDLVNRMQRSPELPNMSVAANMEREETLRTPLPSVWNTTPFAPLPRENKSPQTRPTTAHKVQPDISTPVPMSSGSAFQQDILRRQQQMQLQSTPLQTPLLSSSWSYNNGSAGKHLPQMGQMQSSPWTDHSPMLHSSPYVGHEVPRRNPLPAMFGAIGQTPPSGQAG